MIRRVDVQGRVRGVQGVFPGPQPSCPLHVCRSRLHHRGTHFQDQGFERPFLSWLWSQNLSKSHSDISLDPLHYNVEPQSPVGRVAVSAIRYEIVTNSRYDRFFQVCHRCI